MMKFNHLIFPALFCVFFHLSALFGLPVITEVSPHFGPIAGGTLVTIKGTGFKEVKEVNFGKIPSLSFQVIDEETLEALAPPQTFGAIHLKIVTSEGDSTPVHAAYYTYQGSWFAYIPNFSSNTVTPINLSTGNPEGNIEVGDQPNAVAIAPDGKTAYVTISGLDSIVPIDLSTHQAGSPIAIKGSFPALLSITPDGKKLYVVSQHSHRVTAVDLATYQIKVYDYSGYDFPFSIATAPNGLMAYITNSGSNAVTPFDLTTHRNQENINKFNHPASLALTPDGKKAYVVNAGSNSVTPLDLENHYIGPEIMVGVTNHTGIFADIAICPEGKKAYVTNPGSNTVTPIDLRNEQTGSEIPVGYCPDGIAITPDGKMAYVANAGSNHITPIDLESEIPKEPIAVGEIPSVPAITPDQAPVAYFNMSVASAGSESAFDASASVSPVGTIVRYAWDFGDGSPTVDSKESGATHLYSLPGKYRVTLTVENSAGTSTKPIFTGRTMNRNGGESAKFSQMIEIVQAALPSLDEEDLLSETPCQAGAEEVPTPNVKEEAVVSNVEEEIAASNLKEEAVVPSVKEETVVANMEEEIVIQNVERTALDEIPVSLPQISQPPISDQKPVTPVLQQPQQFSAVPVPVLTQSTAAHSPFHPQPQPLPATQASAIPFVPSSGSDDHSSSHIEPTGMDQFLRPCAPSHLRGYHKKVSSRGKKYVLHVLTWKAPKTGSKPVCYRIYHNQGLTQLAGEVSARKNLKFQMRQKKGAVQTYYIVSVDKFGRKSAVAGFVVPAMGKKK